jgi:hypothetical protein
MSTTPLINSIENLETSSAGVSRKSYGKPLNPNQLRGGKDNFDKIYLTLSPFQLTGDVSIFSVEEDIQSLINQDSINKEALQHEAISKIFSRKGVAGFQYSRDSGTSTFSSHYLSIDSFPNDIKEYLDRISINQESESVLYEIADLIAEWLIDAPNGYQIIFTAYLQSIPFSSSRILLSALSDADFSTSNEYLIHFVSSFIKSDDKRLAQTAATFLLTCGGDLGKIFLSQLLTQELPHLQLIQGINKLLG